VRLRGGAGRFLLGGGRLSGANYTDYTLLRQVTDGGRYRQWLRYDTNPGDLAEPNAADAGGHYEVLVWEDQSPPRAKGAPVPPSASVMVASKRFHTLGDACEYLYAWRMGVHDTYHYRERGTMRWNSGQKVVIRSLINDAVEQAHKHNVPVHTRSQPVACPECGDQHNVMLRGVQFVESNILGVDTHTMEPEWSGETDEVHRFGRNFVYHMLYCRACGHTDGGLLDLIGEPQQERTEADAMLRLKGWMA